MHATTHVELRKATLKLPIAYERSKSAQKTHQQSTDRVCYVRI